MHQPKAYAGIMVSSTFTDLAEHRAQVIAAIEGSGFHANVMESSGPRADKDVIDTSLQMVADAAAYIGVISHKYGQTPYCARRNPDRLSITELEFNEAMRLGRPILLFIMGDDHPVKPADVERDPDKLRKLDAFRERAKRYDHSGEVQRIHQVFQSREDFVASAATAIGNLARLLGDARPAGGKQTAGGGEDGPIRPPQLLALPRYLGSHRFLGRAAELAQLNDWCTAADPNPMLLFEAIGGSGKSILAWEWLSGHAPGRRGDWAGRFWYSFYERGAVMAGFCRHALAYITGTPVENFNTLRTPALADRLVAELEKRPWLLVLDGLERVLVAYNRYDAAQMRDEDADTAHDDIADRDPLMTIRPEDDDLLRRLTAAAPSKILVTSRLTPLALVNRSGQPLPGVVRTFLPGLRPSDAEALFRACGITGESKAIQDYLQTNCDCHGLVVGVLAGLVNHYKRAPGDFDRWAADPEHGGALDLATLDLRQRRNHILAVALADLAPASRRLLHTLALLHSGADFDTLEALAERLKPPPAQGAWPKLEATIDDLEKRGLLQYEDRKYDLHPVVRGVAAGAMDRQETQTLGREVVDYFNSKPHRPYEKAETWEDVASGVEIVRVLLRMGRFGMAFDAYKGDLATALLFNLGAAAETLELLKPFFPNGWDRGTSILGSAHDNLYLMNDIVCAFASIDANRALSVSDIQIPRSSQGKLHNLTEAIKNRFMLYFRLNRLADAIKTASIYKEIALSTRDRNKLFLSSANLYALHSEFGEIDDAKMLHAILHQIEHTSISYDTHRQGDIETSVAADNYYNGKLTETTLATAELHARVYRNFHSVIYLNILRGEWNLTQGKPALAIAPLAEAARMVRETGRADGRTEALLVLARLRAGERVDARAEAERLGHSEDRAALALAELWREIGDEAKAVEFALKAHTWAVADGEPYVHRFYLNRTRALLTELGQDLPEVPTYDPATRTVFPWEEQVRKRIEQLKAERDAEPGIPSL